MDIEHDNGLLRVAVAGYPGLFLLATDPERYPDELLARLARCLAHAGVPPEQPVLFNELREALRLIGRPALLGAHPLALRLDLSVEQRGAVLDRALRTVIDQLEQGSRSRSGTLVRLRYLDGMSVKEVRRQLYLSESHYHRLHHVALEWIARDLATALNPS
ncbi:hypothetical protein EKD04_012675 [Chloroflexales bacterium ZM16-3]|nr:hypothetical protein [Chloroflexales bacterium ZM16-3]